MSYQKKNSSSSQYSIIPGSCRRSARLPGSSLVGKINQKKQIRINVCVRPRTSQLLTLINDMDKILPPDRQYLTRSRLHALHGASSKDLKMIKKFALKHGLEVIKAGIPNRIVVLQGTASSLSSAFNVKLKYYRYRGQIYRGRRGPVSVPRELASLVQAVVGLDDRPQFGRPHFHSATKINESQKNVTNNPPSESYTPIDISRLYNFPLKSIDGTISLDGRGQCIGIVEMGGGFVQEEVAAFLGREKIPMSNIVSVPVGDGSNRPGVDEGMDGEVMLDILVASSVAPRAQIVVYFSESTTRGFLDAISQAIHDKEHNPSVISICWGLSEDTNGWGQLMDAINETFQDAAALGKTICCSSGDRGSYGERPPNGSMIDNLAHVRFPASSPFVLACGGTQVKSAGGVITDEVVWNDGHEVASGGGISDHFRRPSYQEGMDIPGSINGGDFDGRGVPDVAGFASPGYSIPVHGKVGPNGRGGTSAVAPLWAGLIALINQSLGRAVGFINPILYKTLASTNAFRDINSGNNSLCLRTRTGQVVNVKGYDANVGWDCCTGLGSPNGREVLCGLT